MPISKAKFCLIAILTLAVFPVVTSCGTGQEQTSIVVPAMVKDVTPSQANVLIQKNKGNENFVILDVRTPEEFAEGHFSGAINVDYYAANFKDKVGKLDKSKAYLVYCRTGIRSAAASKIMAGLGFQKINNMTGGITDWKALGFPVVK